MNTPRTKKPKRYKRKPPTSPKGWYAHGIADSYVQAVIGRIIVDWVHLEENMVGFFQHLIGVDNGNSARMIFRSIINQSTRITIMRNMLENAPQHQHRPESFDVTIAEFAALNSIRNKYAHGLWYTLDGTPRFFIQEASDEYHSFQAKREVTVAELEAVLMRFRHLGNQLDAHRKARQVTTPIPLRRKPLQQPNGNNPLRPPPEAK